MKNLSRLTALLLALVMLLGITASATEIDSFTKADYDELVAEQLTPVELPALTATDSGFNFAVAGEVPENAELYVTYMGADTTANIRTSILGLPELEEGMSEYAFDISIYENDTEWQPGTPVEVTITGIDTTEDSQVQVYHIPDPAQPAVATYSLRSTPAETAPVEFEEVEAIPGEGTVTFMADGFSVYYVVAGGMENTILWWGDGISITEPSTINVMAGSRLFFMNNVTGSDTDYFDVNGQYVTIAQNTPVGESIKVTCNGYTVTIVVKSQQEVVANLVSKPIVLSVLRNASNGVPGEPANTSNTFDNVNSNYNLSSGNFASSGTGYIDPNIGTMTDFVGSIDGSATMGIYDPTGKNTSDVLMNINWDTILDKIAASNTNFYATDKTEITTANKGDYKVIPYVIKYMVQSGNQLAEEWHIDLAIVPKTYKTLGYQVNFPSGYYVDGLKAPNAQSSDKDPAEFTVQYITQSGNVTVGKTFAVEDINGNDYTITYLGWSTDSNASEADPYYAPGKSVEITKDTLLYGVWKIEGVPATLTVTKNVLGVATGDLPADLVYNYTIRDNISGNTTNFSLNAGNNWTYSSQLEHSEYTITETNPSADIAGYNYSKTEIVSGNTTTEAAAITMTLNGGNTYTLQFNNTYAIATAPLTITKSGMQNNEAAIVTVKVGETSYKIVLNNENGFKAVIPNLTIGSTYTITEDTNWSWRYNPNPEYTYTGTNDENRPAIVPGGSSVEVKNAPYNNKWLSDESAIINFD